jgi:hypothetical protein
MPVYAEREFRRYVDCGILAHGFARARCGQCGHDFLIAFLCKGRGVCPSCNSRRMVATVAHLTDQVLPPLPVRQWVLAVPKRLRCFLRSGLPSEALIELVGLGGLGRHIGAGIVLGDGFLAKWRAAGGRDPSRRL